MTDVTSQEIAETKLDQATTFAEAVRHAQNIGVFSTTAEILGDGFVSTDKAELVGTTFIILSMKIVEGRKGEMVVVKCITDQNNKVVFTDGSTGVFRQCRTLIERGFSSGVGVEGGLRKSEYLYDGKNTATTYYLNT